MSVGTRLKGVGLVHDAGGENALRHRPSHFASRSKRSSVAQRQRPVEPDGGTEAERSTLPMHGLIFGFERVKAMRILSARALLPAAALLAIGGCSSNLPNGSRVAVPSGSVAPTGTVISASPVVTTPPYVVTTPPYVATTTTTPVVTSNGTIVNVPANGTTSVVTTTTTPGAVPGTVTYVPTQTASVAAVTTLAPRLNSTEIMTLLAGNTASGIASNGQPYYVRFAPDGRLRFREADFNDSGSWRVTSDNRLCSTMTRTNVGIEQCYALYRDGPNVDFERDGARMGSFTVLSGDPMNL
jgi:hypothetical protein